MKISPVTHRRFILGKQGLYPGRRWQGKAGALTAIESSCVVQVDPLNVVARNHDIVLYGRVDGYRAKMLDELLYTDRAAFDYGGTVTIQPMSELPYWRVPMQLKVLHPRWAQFAADHADEIANALAAIRERGPLGARDFEGGATKRMTSGFRTARVAGQVLYYLWLGGQLMSHSRRGFERIYDLTERVAPPHLQYIANAEESEAFFALKTFREMSMATLRSWRSWFNGNVVQPIDLNEATARLDALLKAGTIVPVTLESAPKMPHYILAEDLPLLETLHAGNMPTQWQVPITTDDEMVLFAPLEIVSTRGRALPLFGFDYLWEVYKPEAKRRWGYYTLPILYEDRLVARLDPKLDRTTGTLNVKGFWLEDGIAVDDRFLMALAAGLKRFMQFIGATSLAFEKTTPPDLCDKLVSMLPVI